MKTFIILVLILQVGALVLGIIAGSIVTPLIIAGLIYLIIKYTKSYFIKKPKEK